MSERSTIEAQIAAYERQIAALSTRLAAYDQYGKDDDYEVGCILVVEVLYSRAKWAKTYTFCFHKVESNVWYHGRDRLTFDGMVARFTTTTHSSTLAGPIEIHPYTVASLVEVPAQ